MSPALRHYLLTEHVIGAMVVNALLNALIAWASLRHLSEVPMWGVESIGADMIGTTIILPLLTCLIVTRIVAWHVRQGKISAAGWTGDRSLLDRLPSGAFRRGLALGAITTAVAVPLLLTSLAIAGVTSLELGSFVLFKAFYAAVLAAFVQPVVALWALTNPAAEHEVVSVEA
jgi:hypothetical protein